MIKLTNTSISTFKRCPYEYYLSYVLGITPEIEKQSFRFGSAVHDGLDLLAQGYSYDTVAANAIDFYSDMPPWVDGAESVKAWWIEAEACIALLYGYLQRYGSDGYEVIETEQEFELPIVNPATGRKAKHAVLGGKIDKIFRLPDGRLANGEHKTTGLDISPSSDFWGHLRMDQQVTIYVMSSRAMGYDVATTIYDVIKKPRMAARSPEYKMKKAEKDQLKESLVYYGIQFTQDEYDMAIAGKKETSRMYGARITHTVQAEADVYYQRREVARLDADLDRFRQELWWLYQVIHECGRRGFWYRNTSACITKYRCTFCDVCFNDCQPNRDNCPSGYKFKTTMHPELGEDDDCDTSSGEADCVPTAWDTQNNRESATLCTGGD